MTTQEDTTTEEIQQAVVLCPCCDFENALPSTGPYSEIGTKREFKCFKCQEDLSYTRTESGWIITPPESEAPSPTKLDEETIGRLLSVEQQIEKAEMEIDERARALKQSKEWRDTLVSQMRMIVQSLRQRTLPFKEPSDAVPAVDPETTDQPTNVLTLPVNPDESDNWACSCCSEEHPIAESMERIEEGMVYWVSSLPEASQAALSLIAPGIAICGECYLKHIAGAEPKKNGRGRKKKVE